MLPTIGVQVALLRGAGRGRGVEFRVQSLQGLKGVEFRA